MRRMGRTGADGMTVVRGASRQVAANVRPTARFVRGLFIAILLALPLWIAIFLLVRFLLARV